MLHVGVANTAVRRRNQQSTVLVVLNIITNYCGWMMKPTKKLHAFSVTWKNVSTESQIVNFIATRTTDDARSQSPEHHHNVLEPGQSGAEGCKKAKRENTFTFKKNGHQEQHELMNTFVSAWRR